jgi:hypothetical protein
MKTTVTTGASVASPSSIDEALESGFLPNDLTYRKTGRFADDTNTGSHSAQPSEDQEEEEQELEEDQEEQEEEETPATSGEKDGETAAASQAAPTQKKDEEEAGTEPRQQKTADKAESRWAKLSRENKELREKLARRDSQAQPTAQARETTQVSPPAAESKAEPRPKIDDVDAKTGQPKYASYADYQTANDEWLQNDTIRKFQATQAKTDRDRQLAHAKQVVIQKWNDDVAKARTKHADFDAVALNNDLPLKEGTVPDVFILESPQGADVLYYLGKNPGELERINGLNPIAQARELTKIELKVSGNSSAGTSAKPITQAPRPPHQVSGKGTVAKDSVEAAVEEQDADAYMREQNSRDPRLRSVRANRKK